VTTVGEFRKFYAEKARTYYAAAYPGIGKWSIGAAARFHDLLRGLHCQMADGGGDAAEAAPAQLKRRNLTQARYHVPGGAPGYEAGAKLMKVGSVPSSGSAAPPDALMTGPPGAVMNDPGGQGKPGAVLNDPGASGQPRAVLNDLRPEGVTGATLSFASGEEKQKYLLVEVVRRDGGGVQALSSSVQFRGEPLVGCEAAALSAVGRKKPLKQGQVCYQGHMYKCIYPGDGTSEVSIVEAARDGAQEAILRMIGYEVDRFSIDLDHDSQSQIRAYLDAVLEELLARYETHGTNVFAGYFPRCPCDGHDVPMVRGRVPEDDRLWHCSACLLTARRRMAEANIGAGLAATPEACGVLPTESDSLVFYCQEHDWITCRLCAGETCSNPWEVRDCLPRRPDPLRAELPATKRQNPLLSEIDELLERTFKNSDEEKEQLNSLESDVPLFRGRLRTIAAENGKPKG
jgi:hypothetical protein